MPYKTTPISGKKDPKDYELCKKSAAVYYELDNKIGIWYKTTKGLVGAVPIPY
jgi:hypothetical protein